MTGSIRVAHPYADAGGRSKLTELAYQGAAALFHFLSSQLGRKLAGCDFTAHGWAFPAGAAIHQGMGQVMDATVGAMDGPAPIEQGGSYERRTSEMVQSDARSVPGQLSPRSHWATPVDGDSREVLGLLQLAAGGGQKLPRPLLPAVPVPDGSKAPRHVQTAREYAQWVRFVGTNGHRPPRSRVQPKNEANNTIPARRASLASSPSVAPGPAFIEVKP